MLRSLISLVMVTGVSFGAIAQADLNFNRGLKRPKPDYKLFMADCMDKLSTSTERRLEKGKKPFTRAEWKAMCIVDYEAN